MYTCTTVVVFLRTQYVLCRVVKYGNRAILGTQSWVDRCACELTAMTCNTMMLCASRSWLSDLEERIKQGGLVKDPLQSLGCRVRPNSWPFTPRSSSKSTLLWRKKKRRRKNNSLAACSSLVCKPLYRITQYQYRILLIRILNLPRHALIRHGEDYI